MSVRPPQSSISPLVGGLLSLSPVVVLSLIFVSGERKRTVSIGLRFLYLGGGVHILVLSFSANTGRNVIISISSLFPWVAAFAVSFSDQHLDHFSLKCTYIYASGLLSRRLTDHFFVWTRILSIGLHFLCVVVFSSLSYLRRRR